MKHSRNYCIAFTTNIRRDSTAFCGRSRLIRHHSVFAIQFFLVFSECSNECFFIPRAAVLYVPFFALHSLSAMSCTFFCTMNFWYAVDQSNRMWTCIACNRIFLHKIVAIHLSLCVYVWLVIEQYYLQRPRGSDCMCVSAGAYSFIRWFNFEPK